MLWMDSCQCPLSKQLSPLNLSSNNFIHLAFWKEGGGTGELISYRKSQRGCSGQYYWSVPAPPERNRLGYSRTFPPTAADDVKNSAASVHELKTLFSEKGLRKSCIMSEEPRRCNINAEHLYDLSSRYLWVELDNSKFVHCRLGHNEMQY